MDTIIAILIFAAVAALVMNVSNFLFGEDHEDLEPW